MRKHKEILIIPDSHARMDAPNDRFSWAGEFALDRQPNAIINIGDMADMTSLSMYDIGKLPAEGRRYEDDIHASHNACHLFNRAIQRYNNTHTKWKKKKYQPTMVITLGNHENRIPRACNEDPKLEGKLSLRDLAYESYGWEVIPYLQPYVYEDIAFQHYFTSGVLGRPIGGDNHAATLVKKGLMSCVQGHSHTRDFSELTDAIGRKRFGLVVGCYYDHPDHFTTEADRYWRGLVYLHDVQNGQAEPEFLAFDYLKRKYG